MSAFKYFMKTKRPRSCDSFCTGPVLHQWRATSRAKRRREAQGTNKNQVNSTADHDRQGQAANWQCLIHVTLISARNIKLITSVKCMCSLYCLPCSLYLTFAIHVSGLPLLYKTCGRPGNEANHSPFLFLFVLLYSLLFIDRLHCMYYVQHCWDNSPKA